MARWEPDAQGRLERAALDLFHEHGFDAVSVPQIAARAGLTTRTFFRHFKDKREVLFVDAARMPALAARLVREAPPGLAPMEVVGLGLPQLASGGFAPYEQLARRAAVVAGHEGLRERELSKMEAVVAAIASAFRERDVDATASEVVAEAAVGVVKVALGQWMAGQGEMPLEAVMDNAFRSLRGAASVTGSAPRGGDTRSP